MVSEDALSPVQREELEFLLGQLAERWEEEVAVDGWSFDAARDLGLDSYTDHLLDRVSNIGVWRTAVEDIADLMGHSVDVGDVSLILGALIDQWRAVGTRFARGVSDDNLKSRQRQGIEVLQAAAQLETLVADLADEDGLVEAIDSEASLLDLEEFAATWKEAVKSGELARTRWHRDNGHRACVTAAIAASSPRFTELGLRFKPTSEE